MKQAHPLRPPKTTRIFGYKNKKSISQVEPSNNSYDSLHKMKDDNQSSSRVSYTSYSPFADNMRSNNMGTSQVSEWSRAEQYNNFISQDEFYEKNISLREQIMKQVKHLLEEQKKQISNQMTIKTIELQSNIKKDCALQFAHQFLPLSFIQDCHRQYENLEWKMKQNFQIPIQKVKLQIMKIKREIQEISKQVQKVKPEIERIKFAQTISNNEIEKIKTNIQLIWSDFHKNVNSPKIEMKKRKQLQPLSQSSNNLPKITQKNSIEKSISKNHHLSAKSISLTLSSDSLKQIAPSYKQMNKQQSIESTNYILDSQNYLMDGEGNYLQDENNQQIRLSEQQIEKLMNSDLLKWKQI